MKYSKLILVIITLLIGMVIPVGIRQSFSDLLFGAMFMWIIVNQEVFFGKNTKKATTHRHE
ncbi:hypothetical protein [Lapidilactobacillus bayanensis]|uniref:hypothetical protein n=1 Tax=Lapidilactobacillus bayanensis TaxID=2485998 RepID=UPI000F7AABE4|nr:hypothetical protein [Lapidilactobacillus bayanensis]